MRMRTSLNLDSSGIVSFRNNQWPERVLCSLRVRCPLDNKTLSSRLTSLFLAVHYFLYWQYGKSNKFVTICEERNVISQVEFDLHV